MNDRTLLAASLGISIIGLLLLGIGVALKEPRHTEIGSVTESDKGDLVVLDGTATDVRYNGNHLFFKVTDGTGKISVVMFENDIVRQGFYALDVTEGTRIRAEGRIEVYKGILELVARRLTIV